MARKLIAVLVVLVTLGVTASAADGASDPLCTGNYVRAPTRPGGKVRFGIDPGLAGSTGGVQLPSVPDNPAKDLAAVRRLRPKSRVLVVRLNRLYWSDGDAGIAHFSRLARTYGRAGDEVEIQVRYHPASGEEGNLTRWVAYVRHVVDVLGANRHVVAMTITNEVNITVSPNTSDGSFKGAEDALIRGIEAAHAEADRRHYRRLRFGFTYAYRLSPAGDAAFFKYLAVHGGSAFRRALGFIGLEFYPGTFYPPVMAPGDTYRRELAQAAGVVRDCFAPMAGIGSRVPIWITENGVPTGVLSATQQAAALSQLVRAVHDYSRTYGITDYRWFNLRDSVSSGPETLSALTFATDGLLRADYVPKPSFAEYRRLIAALGTRSAAPSKSGSASPVGTGSEAGSSGASGNRSAVARAVR